MPSSSFPLPSPAATLAPVPIRFDRARVGIVPGTTVAVDVAGGAGLLHVSAPGPFLDVSFDAVARRAYLAARAEGSGTVTIVDDAGDRATLDVLVAPPAGSVPGDVSLQLGGNVSPAYVLARTNAAIAHQAQLRPGATLDVHGITVAQPMTPGTLLEGDARVKIDGAQKFVDVVGTAHVHVRVDAYPKVEPQELLYSDDPERLGAASDGVLYRSTIDAGRSARAYVYHVSDVPERRLYLVLQSAATSTAVQLLGYSAGPENAFGYVGHRSTLAYLQARASQESTVVNVAANAPYVVPLAERAMRAGDLIASIFDLRALDGGAFTVSIVATTGERDPLDALAGPELPGDGHGRRGEFSLGGVPPLALALTVGQDEPKPFAVGAPTIANLRPGGRALGGDYGVVRPVSLTLANPGATPRSVYLYEQPAGGNASTTMWLAGDPAPLEIPCVRLTSSRYAVKAFDLAAGETRMVTGEYMTDGASYFPLLFGLTTAPPSPPPGPASPEACTPKAPPAPPSAAPTASPGAPAPASPSAAPSPSATPG